MKSNYNCVLIKAMAHPKMKITLALKPSYANTLYCQKYWDTPFFRREKGTSKLWQLSIIPVLKMYFHLCCNSFEVYKRTAPMFGSAFFSLLKKGVSQYFCPYNECTSHWCLVMNYLAQGLHLKSHQRCSAGIRTCLSADQSSSSTLTQSSFLFDPCLIHRNTVMLE